MEKKKKFIVDVVFWGLVLLLVWAACKFILPVMIPFIIAFTIASLLQIPVRRLCRNYPEKKRAISVTVCIIFFALAAALVAALGAKAFSSMVGLMKSLPSVYQNEVAPAFGALLKRGEAMLATLDPAIAAEIHKVLQQFLSNIGSHLSRLSMNAVKILSGGLVGIPAVVIRLIVTIISTFFWMADYDKIMDFCGRCIPAGKRDTVRQLIQYVKKTIVIYLKSYSILFLLTFVELSIGFTILRIPYPILVALGVAIFDIMPILGTGGILLPWAVILVVMGDYLMALGMLLLYLVITIVRQSVEPKVVGKQIGLHTLATLISMYLGLELIGILGMFIFPVTLTILIGMKRDVPVSPLGTDKKEA